MTSLQLGRKAREIVVEHKVAILYKKILRYVWIGSEHTKNSDSGFPSVYIAALTTSVLLLFAIE